MVELVTVRRGRETPVRMLTLVLLCEALAVF